MNIIKSPVTSFTFCFLLLYLHKSKVNTSDVKFLGTETQFKITNYYKFQTPQVFVECLCNNNSTKHTGICSFVDKYGTCTRYYDNMSRCDILVKPYKNSNEILAVQLDSNVPGETNYVIEYRKKNDTLLLKVPEKIRQIIIDNAIFKIRKLKSHKNIFFTERSWFYIENGSKNLKTIFYSNTMNETNFRKLGWFRFDTKIGKFFVNQQELLKSLNIDSTACPEGNVFWSLNIANYYDQNGILHSEVIGDAVREKRRTSIHDTKVKVEDNKLILEYNPSDINQNRLQTLDATKAINFTASITVDKFSSKMIHLTIFEKGSSIFYVEIGEPDSPVNSLTLYHEKSGQIHQQRISHIPEGPQWVCIFSANNFYYAKKTCVKSTYNETYFPGPKNRFTFKESSEYNLNIMSVSSEKYSSHAATMYEKCVFLMVLIICNFLFLVLK